MTWSILEGDVLDRLRDLPDESVQCCVTSPPYWGLRDYGVEGQIGLEASPDEHVAKLVKVFREVRRVLRSDGVLWLNYGDVYATGAGRVGDHPGGGKNGQRARACAPPTPLNRMPIDGLKPKDLIGLPWMLAFGLRVDGWWLRSDIIWSKPNPMPSSVTDRPTRAHEYVFLLTKSARYFYDQDAIREPGTGRPPGNVNPDRAFLRDPEQFRIRSNLSSPRTATTRRNARTVWTINPQPFSGAHFAVFPEALAERCIRAGTSEKGACAKCGAPWLRVVEKGEPDRERQRACGADSSGGYNGTATKDYGASRAEDPSAVKARILAGMRERHTTGWRPSCECGAGAGTHHQPYEPVPCVVLDPFAGSGTTLLVAERLGRDSAGIELSAEYATIARRRIQSADPMEPVRLSPVHTQQALWGTA